ncbi:hypothetical protein FQA39_LY13486 [Lamprigera yunnana]|nr:hypothetical protein FQA39_LY13486 [Lamprigera yunnana]
MCPGCGRVMTIVQIIWSLVYVTCGAAQLVAGIFFIISLPELHLSSNIWTGSWNVIMGIAAGMTACFSQLSSRRQELLLYMAISILAANAVNTVLTEWCLYWTDLPKLLINRPYQTLIYYSIFATRIAGGVVILSSFIDTQLLFCSMETARKQNNKKLRRSHEQVTDIEYIIPRQKSSKPYSAYNAYAQSWVFDADNGSCSNNGANSPYVKLSQNGTPKSSTLQPTVDANTKPPAVTHVIGNPVVQIEEASDDSTSNSDRKLNYMKSFSPCASPLVLSACSSQLSLNTNSINNPPIYECLEKLTEASVYRSRLNSALSNKEDNDSQYQSPHHTMFRKVEAITPHGEKVQYASLMKELETAIVNKKGSDVPSSQSGSSRTDSKSSSRQDSSRTDGKNSDAEFSKELEAALQLIQDLESPNTIETPSEPKSSIDGKDSRPLAVWRNSDASDSDKTLSAVGSLAELTSPISECHPELCTFKPPAHGKDTRVIVHCDSQSTSGYSSPTHKSSSHTPNWSTSSSINGSHHDLGKPLSYSIHNTKSTAVISLYTDSIRSRGKSVTLVNICGAKEPVHKSSNHIPHRLIDDSQKNNYKTCSDDSFVSKANGASNNVSNLDGKMVRSSSGAGSIWNVKSMLRKKKQGLPKLCPELEGAIVKSESLAYLSELELLARHQRTKDLQRQIEQKVLQQLGSPRTESNC